MTQKSSLRGESLQEIETLLQICRLTLGVDQSDLADAIEGDDCYEVAAAQWEVADTKRSIAELEEKRRLLIKNQPAAVTQ